jgi:hypothetical protein
MAALGAPSVHSVCCVLLSCTYSPTNDNSARLFSGHCDSYFCDLKGACSDGRGHPRLPRNCLLPHGCVAMWKKV